MSNKGRIIPVTDLSRAAHVRKPASVAVVDGIEVASFRVCCHCATHFMSVRGSGIARGFCTRCMGDTCGAERCVECIPFAKKLEDYEKGKRITLL